MLSSPKRVHTYQEVKKQWIDISIVLDVSLSMEANDFTPNRLESAKRAIQQIVRSRTTDRIWLIVFSGKPFISLPLHDEYHIIEEMITHISTRIIDQQHPELQGTAIGDALLASIWILETAKQEDREQIILLISDGDANIWIDPLLIARLAAEKNIKIYTLGIWSIQGGMVETPTAFGIRQQRVAWVDDELLQTIATITKWTYTRIIDDEQLSTMLQEIWSLHQQEISKVIQRQYTDARGLFFVFLVISMMIYLYQERRFIVS